MRPHGGFLLLLCVLGCLAGIGLVVFGLGTDTAAAEIAATDPPADGTGRGVATDAPAQPAAVSTDDGVFRRQDHVAVVEAAPPKKRTSGLIRGDITMTASAIAKIDTVTIRIVEAVREDVVPGRRPFTYHHAIKFDPKDGTPSFSLDEIPFASAGYIVQAFAPGLNGTEQWVHLNEQSPVADVVLGLHPGVPFSILLRDQDLAPLVDVEVTLTPEGTPQGRGAYYKKTDTFGAAVFEDVLRGAYQVHVGPTTQPLLAPQPIDVLANSGVTAQSKTIVVPKGESLTVNLYTPSGHGISEVEVKLTSGSDVRYREIKQKTDWSGRATFAHLAPGSYWVNVLDPRYEPRTVPVAVRAAEKTKDVDIRLVMR